MFNNLEDALSWIEVQKKWTKRTDLSDITYALSLLGNPQDKYKTIHIGGTNGKGSVSKSVSEILKYHGLKVGLFVSPHISCYNERIEINGNYISDSDFLRLINEMYEFNEEFRKTRENLAFFELLTLIAFKYFMEQSVDIAVIEVGLGGRLDCTNVITPLVSAVTNIQKDHMEQLGNTFYKILNEKLGIMKNRVPFVTTIEKEELMPKIKEKSILMQSDLHLVRNVRSVKLLEDGTSFTYNRQKYKTGLIGLHQAKNTALAIEIINVLNENYGYNITKNSIDNALKSIKWPGRFELFEKNIILDGGHNPEGIESLANTLKRFTYSNILTVFTCMKDKRIDEMVPIIDSFSSRIIFTEIDYQRCEKAKNLFDLSNNKEKMMIDSSSKAYTYALKHRRKDEVIVFCGSLYFIGEIREKLLKR